MVARDDFTARSVANLIAQNPFVLHENRKPRINGLTCSDYA